MCLIHLVRINEYTRHANTQSELPTKPAIHPNRSLVYRLGLGENQRAGQISGHPDFLPGDVPLQNSSPMRCIWNRRRSGVSKRTWFWSGFLRFSGALVLPFCLSPISHRQTIRRMMLSGRFYLALGRKPEPYRRYSLVPRTRCSCGRRPGRRYNQPSLIGN